MALFVETARLSYGGPDRLNVTRGSGNIAGAPFAPSHELLGRYLEQMRRAKEIEDDARGHEKTVSRARPDMAGAVTVRAKAEAEAIRVAAFEAYAPEFIQEMRLSYKKNWRAWRELLLRKHVVLTCYCVHPERCHRFLLRTLVLPKLGAVDGGELSPEAQRRVTQPKGTMG
jgi:uncharacterized protein YeaO (DUF488 family)